MKKRVLVSVMLLSVGLSYAQKSPSNSEKMQEYGRKIDSIVSVEKKQMIEELAQLEQKNLSQQEKDEERVKLAEKYEKQINDKISKQRMELNNLTKERVREIVMRPQQEESPKEENKDKKVVVISKKSGGFGISLDYSFLNLAQKSGSFNPFESESKMRVGNSHSFEVGLRKKRQLGDRSTPFFINYGVAYRSDTYMPKSPLIFTENSEILSLTSVASRDVKRSKLRSNYLILPVDFQWVVNPKYREYEGQKILINKKQFRIGLGVYAGVNLRSMIKANYINEQGKTEKYKHKVDYGVNPFLMGGKLSLSYGGFTLFMKKDFTLIFNANAQLPAKNGIQIGVDVMNLIF